VVLGGWLDSMILGVFSNLSFYESCPIATGKIIRTHLLFTGGLLVPRWVCLATLQDTCSAVVSAGSVPLLQFLN